MSPERAKRPAAARRFATRAATFVVFVVVAWLIYSTDRPADSGSAGAGSNVETVTTSPAAEAFASRSSGVMMTLEGTVIRILPDDEDGSRHQRFIVRLPDDHTVLVSHNIDLAPRAPVVRSAPITIRGQYEWNDQGGVIHWTHHDPDGDRAGGWIEVDGKRYR